MCWAGLGWAGCVLLAYLVGGAGLGCCTEVWFGCVDVFRAGLCWAGWVGLSIIVLGWVGCVGLAEVALAGKGWVELGWVVFGLGRSLG